METIVYFIRHSEQLKNNLIVNTHETSQISNEKIVLSVNGEKLAQKLSKIKELANIDVIWSSNYVRAIATAKYISNENRLAINVDSNFGERKLGNLNTLKDLEKIKTHSYTTEQLLDHNFKNKAGESFVEVYNRVISAFNKVLNDNIGKRIVIVSHGAAIKFALLKWCEFDKNTYEIKFNGKIIAGEKLNSPEVFKLVFKDKEIKDILNVKIEK